MKVACWSLKLVVVVVAPILVAFCGIASAANITAVDGNRVTIDGGADTGVVAGMTGSVTTDQSVGGNVRSFEIARFEVTEVGRTFSTAFLIQTGAGWTIEKGMRVSFDQAMSPPEPKTAILEIRSNVAGDLAYLNDRRLGPTPQRLEVAPGSHRIRVEKEGCETQERTVQLAVGQSETIRLTIRCDTAPGELWLDPAIGMRFRYIPPGEFEMGSPASERDRKDDERVHSVRITRGYWMGETEVMQGEWGAVLGSNPSRFSSCGSDCPVERVSWYEAVAFSNALSRRAGLEECYRVSDERVTFEGLECEGYRLPTEAEWEFAARAGERHQYAGGDELGAVGWHNSAGSYPVGQKRANPWGLYDMSGNVWEWCWDWYGEYPSRNVMDPVGHSGSGRIKRGGSWGDNPGSCRLANREKYPPGFSTGYLGFRLVRTAAE